jgi:hypothetical protein
MGRLNSPEGVAAVIESATVRFHEGFFSVSRPHVGGLCLSGGTEARAALVRIAAEHYLYETYTLVGIVEALDYLREPRAAASLMDILKDSVELLKKPGDRQSEPLALAAARALGRLETKRAEPLLIDLLLHLHEDITDTQNAILTIRGEKSPTEFDCERGSLPLRDYEARRKRRNASS